MVFFVVREGSQESRLDLTGFGPARPGLGWPSLAWPGQARPELSSPHLASGQTWPARPGLALGTHENIKIQIPQLSYIESCKGIYFRKHGEDSGSVMLGSRLIVCQI